MILFEDGLTAMDTERVNVCFDGIKLSFSDVVRNLGFFSFMYLLLNEREIII